MNRWLLALTASVTIVGWVLGVPFGLVDWGPYYAQDAVNGLPYLSPPWMDGPLGALQPLGFVGSYFMVSGAGMLLLAHGLRQVPLERALAVLVAQVIALGTGQVTPLLAALALHGLGKHPSNLAAVLVACLIKPTVGLPLACVMLARGRWRELALVGLCGALVAAGTPGFEAWRAATRASCEAILQTRAALYQFGTLRWGVGEHVGLPAGFALAIAWPIRGYGRPSWLVWLVGLVCTPWLFHYDLLGLGAVALALWSLRD